MHQNKPYHIHISFSIQTLGLPVIPVKLFNEENHSLLLVDTGSDRSIMDIAVYNHFKDKITNSEQGQNIITTNGKTSSTLTAQFTFAIDDTQKYTESFTCMDCSTGFNQIEKETGYQLHGILGTDFLVKHQWKIDFEKLQIHT